MSVCLSVLFSLSICLYLSFSVSLALYHIFFSPSLSSSFFHFSLLLVLSLFLIFYFFVFSQQPSLIYLHTQQLCKLPTISSQQRGIKTSVLFLQVPGATNGRNHLRSQCPDSMWRSSFLLALVRRGAVPLSGSHETVLKKVSDREDVMPPGDPRLQWAQPALLMLGELVRKFL